MTESGERTAAAEPGDTTAAVEDAAADEAAVDPATASPLRAGSVWLDGRLVPLHAPHLSVTDRGFQLGDGIFESLRARRGVVIELAEHLSRLHESAAAIALRLPPDAGLVEGMRELLESEGLADPGLDDDRLADPALAGAEQGNDPGRLFAVERLSRVPGDAALRITVSRGPIGRRGLLPAGWEFVTATVAIQAWPYRPPAARLLERGISAMLSRVRRDPASPLAGIKSTSRADHVYAKLEAERAGVDEAIFPTVDGQLSEATTANLFLVSGSRLLTPPLSAAILAGTTRTWLLARASAGALEAHGRTIRVEERRLAVDDIFAADEAFLSSSVAGILPLTRFEGSPVGSGTPGPITLALRAAREDWIDATAMAAVSARRGQAREPRRNDADAD